MAYVSNFEEEEKKQGAPATTSGVSALATGGDGNKAASTKGSGTGWTNLQSYITANQGNDGQMAGQITNRNQSKIDNVNTAKDNWKSTATSDINSGIVNASDKQKGTLQSNPMGFKQDEFNNLYNAEYKGPQDASNAGSYGEFDKANQKYGQFAEDSKTFGGRYNLLSDTYGRSDYGRGSKTLDNFLISAGSEGKQAMKGIQDSYSQFSSGIDKDKADINSQINQAQLETSKNKDAWRGLVDGQKKNVKDDVTSQNEWFGKWAIGNGADKATFDTHQNDALNSSAKLKALEELTGDTLSPMEDYASWKWKAPKVNTPIAPLPTITLPIPEAAPSNTGGGGGGSKNPSIEEQALDVALKTNPILAPVAGQVSDGIGNATKKTKKIFGW